MPVMTSSKKHAWWLDLRHSGLVVAPALLEEYFPAVQLNPSGTVISDCANAMPHSRRGVSVSMPMN